MASFSPLPCVLLLILALYGVSSVSARPCKTIFFYTATTATFFPTSSPNDPNPNPNFHNFPFQSHPSKSPKFLTLFFTTVKTPDDKFYFPTRPTAYFSFRSYPFPRFINEEVVENQAQKRSMMPAGFYSSMTRGSIRDRTRDIMSVVGAMLFGVGCGALTAATMYLVWSLTSRFRSEEETDDDMEEDEDVSPKNVGYVVIPDDDIDAIKKAAQAQAKKMEAAGN